MQKVDDYLKEFMLSPGFKALVESDLDFNPPVTLTYAIERLAILHVKLWNLEDMVRNKTFSDEQVGVLKRQIDHLNGVVRPRVVAAIGEILAKAVREGNDGLVREPNLKDYKARS